MNEYKIELENTNTARLIRNDGEGKDGPFDGGSIHHAPENYPAIIHVRVNRPEDWHALARAYTGK